MFASPVQRTPSAQTYRDLLWITLAASLLYLGALGARDLWNPNELRVRKSVQLRT